MASTALVASSGMFKPLVQALVENGVGRSGSESLNRKSSLSLSLSSAVVWPALLCSGTLAHHRLTEEKNSAIQIGITAQSSLPD